MEKEKKIIKSTLLNIDSTYRNIYPKNITTSTGVVLPYNPISLTQNSKIVTINYPNHNLTTSDNIVIQNVMGSSKTLSNYVFLINNFSYAMIIFLDNNIDPNYLVYNPNNMLYATIEIVGSQTENNIINNTPFNVIPGYKQTLLVSDIPAFAYTTAKSTIQQILLNVLNNDKSRFSDDASLFSYLMANCLFIKLPNNYINTTANYYAVNQVFKITYQHIGGIMLGYFNSNFPISNINYQSNYSVYNVIDSNQFNILLNYNSYGTISGGGKIVQIMKLVNTITGYPDASNYVIDLKKSFNNVTHIELISMEIPYVDIVITKNVNDTISWKHIEDGQHIYNAQIEEGMYSNVTLLEKLRTTMNMVPRIVSTSINPIYDSGGVYGSFTAYNYFDITLESNIMKVTFSPYSIINVPNSLAVNLEIINEVSYYILTIRQSNNFINIGDTITISKSIGVTYENSNQNLMIGPQYINKTFTVYSANSGSQTYSIILGAVDSINETISDVILNGGYDTLIKYMTKVSLLLNTNNTLGGVLGFLNPGNTYSVLDYSSIITNKDSYIVSNNVDPVGNPLTYSSGFMNFSGQYNYIIMYLNNIDNIYFNNSLSPAFSKILLDGNTGDILFNTFVTNPENVYSSVYPIISLTDITVKFVYPDGSPINFRNVNHSFTLKITEEHIENNSINLNSQNISHIDEYKKTYPYPSK